MKNKRTWEEVAEEAKQLGIKTWRRTPNGNNTCKVKKTVLLSEIAKRKNQQPQQQEN